MLTPDEKIEKLKAARALVREVYEGTDLPQIQSTIRHADMNLHWALWNLGHVETLRHDLPVD
jgi:ribosome recycling factor